MDIKATLITIFKDIGQLRSRRLFMLDMFKKKMPEGLFVEGVHRLVTPATIATLTDPVNIVLENESTRVIEVNLLE